MKRRIFIAINLPEKLKKRLKEYQEQHDALPVRWTKTASLHLTLVFIGYVDNEQMLEACKITRKIAEEMEPFFINFKRILLGPIGKEPRMIWLEGEVSEELVQLK
ncbi:RNA 2',3'-cyclic phosphodiesterase, partial [Patescibacteria group bacterium]|nr:RNA 2',3'-cyclic phosphodiesterase [Patescibacteria group bacterium]